jgi:hypothetical protein
MSDIRFNRWLHQSGTGGVYQDASGRVGIGSSTPTDALDIVGVASATSFFGPLTGNVTGDVTSSGTSTFDVISGVSTIGVTTVHLTGINNLSYPTAGPLSNRNLVTNGAMRVSQRATTSTSDGYQTCDRWRGQFGGGAVTQSQQSLSSGAPYNEGFRYFMRLQNTTATTANNSYRNYQQRIEGQDVATCGWDHTSSSSYITLSFWVRSSVGQEYEAFVRTVDGTERVYSFPFTLAADTWTKITETVPGNSSNQIDNDNGHGFSIAIIAYYGTDFTTASNADRTWRNRTSSGDYIPDMTSTWSSTTNATFDLTGVQLETGSVATPFEHRSYGDDLARCQRYYYKLIADSGDTFANGYNQNSTATRNILHFPVTMRVAPTALEQTGTAANYRVLHGTTVTACSAVPTLNASTVNTGEVQATTASGLTAGQGNALESNSNGTYLAFTAEL